MNTKNQNNAEIPLISVVTVSYNAIDTIENTIFSVLDQIYSNIEYIIIDGKSTDGTQRIIDKYAESLSYWISEPDLGIFDAMNKGLSVARGEWIIFMNSGDLFYNNRVLLDVFTNNYNGIDLIYGDVELFSSDRDFIYKQKCNKYNINLNSICHQAVFIRRSKHIAFDLRYTLTSDHDIIFGLIKQGNYRHVDVVVAKVLLGGVSYNVFQTSKEKLHISYRRGNLVDKILSPFFNSYQIVKFVFKNALLKVLSKNNFERIARWKSKMESYL
ncbi:glycosyltransferase family 2 protein [Bacteroides sp. 51]|uniref:glycosyltransferase family 2 protein n=1 Tax=Bacteroides sp. 51 TaxID=2302938 RepID=UPI0013D43933|nr:glycosyltransferase family 2 protein [Bacteroides sp. 51]NDV81534.1 glycosyltransferase [Bacteroides sp. 51]